MWPSSSFDVTIESESGFGENLENGALYLKSHNRFFALSFADFRNFDHLFSSMFSLSGGTLNAKIFLKRRRF